MIATVLIAPAIPAGYFLVFIASEYIYICTYSCWLPHPRLESEVKYMALAFCKKRFLMILSGRVGLLRRILSRLLVYKASQRSQRKTTFICRYGTGISGLGFPGCWMHLTLFNAIWTQRLKWCPFSELTSTTPLFFKDFKWPFCARNNIEKRMRWKLDICFYAR